MNRKSVYYTYLFFSIGLLLLVWSNPEESWVSKFRFSLIFLSLMAVVVSVKEILKKKIGERDRAKVQVGRVKK